MLCGCVFDTPARRFRERLTIVVDTPEGEVIGSSVTEHILIFQDGLLGGLANHTMLSGSRGEATTVDLGPRGILFSLLCPDQSRNKIPGHWASSAPGGYEYSIFVDPELHGRPVSGDEANAEFIDYLNREHPKGDVPIDKLGLLVRFRDPNDPATVERVDPMDLAASFGPGVAIRQVIVEIVTPDTPLTTGIEMKLPWLERYAAIGASLDGDTSIARRVDAPLANAIGTGVFKSRRKS